MTLVPLYLVFLPSNDKPTVDYGGYSSSGIIGTETGILDCNKELYGCLLGFR